MSRETLPEVRDGSGDPRKGSGRVKGASRKSGTALGNPLRGPGRVRGHSGKSGTGRGPSERSGTVQGTLR